MEQNPKKHPESSKSHEFGELIAISDIHFIDFQGERGQIFTHLIERILQSGNPPQYFLLLGDICDFYHGKIPYFRKKFSSFWDLLEQLALKGTKVIYLQGNHEFCLEQEHTKNVTLSNRASLTIKLNDGTPFYLIHGDQLRFQWLYQIYRTVAQSSFITTLVRLIPPKQFDKLALYVSHESRKKDPYRTLNHQNILNELHTQMLSHSCQYAIMGHFHMPYAEPVKNDFYNNSRLLCNPSWDTPNALVYRNGTFYRQFYKDHETKEELAKPLEFFPDHAD